MSPLPLFQTLHHPLIKAFLRVEANEYLWHEGVDGEASIEFQNKLFAQLSSKTSDVRCNYVKIVSMSNMGSKNGALVLSPSYGLYTHGQDCEVCLPHRSFVDNVVFNFVGHKPI